VGASALAGSNSGTGENVGVGKSALNANTTGSYNTAVGSASSQFNTTGTFNTALGFGAYAAATTTATGSYNTAIGAQSLINNTTASNNTAVGYQALYTSNRTSDDPYNTAIGAQAGFSAVSSAQVTYMGYRAGYYQTGSVHTAIGYRALFGASGTSTGNYNVAIGPEALYSNTTASNNTAVGYQAGYTNTTGTGNVAFGKDALRLNNTTSNNTAVGAGAGKANTGSENTFIGSDAGETTTTGTFNTFLGRLSGYLVTNGGKNTIIGSYTGNSGGLDIRTASNYIVLSDGDGNPRGYFDDDGQCNVKNAGAGIACFRGYATNASFTGIVFDSFADRNTTNSSFSAYRYYNVGAAAVRFIVQDSGNVQNTNNSYGAVSDIKLKENIVDCSPKLEDLCKVKIRQYNLKSDQTHKQIGVIAQELEQVFAGMVEESTDRDESGDDLGTKTKTVKYSVFVPMLIKAIQEQQAIITALTTRITALEAK
jgi:serine acetyltransferase